MASIKLPVYFSVDASDYPVLLGCTLHTAQDLELPPGVTSGEADFID
ncbi:MAG: hypothetical protein GY768_17230 [Planctomycetaceae bacterium]|nr:hypothetical protein [Planctomycetaceae bacterium]